MYPSTITIPHLIDAAQWEQEYTSGGSGRKFCDWRDRQDTDISVTGENWASRPLCHTQAPDRQISSWVGDHQRIPAVISSHEIENQAPLEHRFLKGGTTEQKTAVMLPFSIVGYDASTLVKYHHTTLFIIIAIVPHRPGSRSHFLSSPSQSQASNITRLGFVNSLRSAKILKVARHFAIMKKSLVVTVLLTSLATACPRFWLLETPHQTRLTIAPGTPDGGVPFVGVGDSTPIIKSTAQTLRDAVTKDYLRGLADNIHPSWYTAETKTVDQGVVMGELILGTIAEGIMCSPGLQACQFTHEVSLTQTYSTSNGVKTTVTATAGIDVSFFSASLSLSREFSWEENFSDEKSTTNRYTFDLKPGTSCRPSMIHVELDCEIEKNTYWLDAYVAHFSSDNSYFLGLKSPEPSERRQHCVSDIIKTQEFAESPLSKDIYWKNTCPWDPNFEEWGAAFIGSSSELTRFIANSAVRPIENNELIIRPSKHDSLGPGRKGSIFQIFRCKIAKPAQDRPITSVPLKGDKGHLLGYIGCV
ncbi:hypothetical protein VTL71DRAFT_11137 [Oculimacula yallundae]|uniref:Uncharacterized protein n=1 Tax=Oculimacula yallundae TaxID=86028 RepID=A0ABR4CV33_9HELO